MNLSRTLPIKRAAHVYLVRGEELLLVEERMDDGSIFYGLPGGKAQPSETLADAAVRQVLVETGLHVTNLEFVSLLEGELLTGTRNECFANFARFTAAFHGELDPTDPEVVGVKWVPFEQVEGLVEQPKGGSRQHPHPARRPVGREDAGEVLEAQLEVGRLGDGGEGVTAADGAHPTAPSARVPHSLGQRLGRAWTQHLRRRGDGPRPVGPGRTHPKFLPSPR